MQEFIEFISQIKTLRIFNLSEDSYVILAYIICAVGTIADWYTTKRRVVDKNLKLIRQGKKPKYKEANLILRWILADPDPADEWRIAAYKLVFILGFIIFGAPIEYYAGFGVMGLLFAINNQFDILSRVIRFFKKKF